MIFEFDMEIKEQKIKNYLSTEFIGSEIHIFERVESTNDTAKELAVNGCKEGTVIIADSQSKGRGRQERRWESPAGVGIYLSIVVKPKKIMPQLTLVAGVSAAEAIMKIVNSNPFASLLMERATPPSPPLQREGEGEVSLKWPNDININGKKAGGILTEGVENGKAIIVGIGINVNTPTPIPIGVGGEGFPDELKDKATSIMIETGRRIDRNILIAEILNKFEFWYKKFIIEEKETVMKRWRELSDTSGRRVKVNVGDSVFEGVALGLDNDGSLMIRLDDGFLKKVSAGEIFYCKNLSSHFR